MVKGTTVLGRIQVQHLSQLMISPTYRVPRRKRFFSFKKERDVLWKDDGQGNLCFREAVLFYFWWMELFIWIFPFSGKKVQHLYNDLFAATNAQPHPSNGWSEAPEGSEKSCYFATFSPAASSCAPAMVRVFGDCAANARPVLTKGLFSSAAWVTMKWEPYLGSVDGGRAWRGRMKVLRYSKKALGLNERDGLQLCRCACKGMIVKSWWYHCLFKLGCHFSTDKKNENKKMPPLSFTGSVHISWQFVDLKPDKVDLRSTKPLRSEGKDLLLLVHSSELTEEDLAFR